MSNAEKYVTRKGEHEFVEALCTDVETPIGPFKLVNWGDSVLFNTPDSYVDGSKPANVTINGVPYVASASAKLEGGEWKMQREYTYMSRPGSFGRDGGTPAAVRKLHEALLTFVTDYMSAPINVKTGTQRRLQADAYRKEQELMRLEGECNEARWQLEAIEKALAELA